MTEHWREQSLCAEIGDTFHMREDKELPKPRDFKPDSDLKIARFICGRCDVFHECQADAIANPDPNAIKAGMTPSQQRKAHKAA